MTPPPSPGPYAQACIAWVQEKGTHSKNRDVALLATSSMVTGLTMGLALGALDEEFARRTVVELQDFMGSVAADQGMTLGPSEIAEAAQRLLQNAKRLANESCQARHRAAGQEPPATTLPSAIAAIWPSDH